MIFHLQVYAYENPFRLGTGKYLKETEIILLYHDIVNSKSPKFNKAFFNVLSDKSQKQLSKIDIIQFQKTFPVLYKTDNPADIIVYLLVYNYIEDRPENSIIPKNGFYDIWVISGYFILFKKSKSTGKYTIIRSGAAG